MIDILRQLLDLREKLHSISRLLEEHGYDGAQLPEIAEMQALERRAFEKVNEWDKPDPE